ncbi:DUF2690 domain-containing protein [Kitasatospora sp. NPDC048298]|uniref:DUF2690 domain-containing protein n=1 Tax=Kitasatospora sp. NPDC048298 TaxID=3364049 RepID=UPI0037182D66
MLVPPVVAPAVATAAPACHGNACDGRSPKATGCGADARTIPGTVIDPGSNRHPQAWLRYSKQCDAVWAQGEESDGSTIRVQIDGGASYDAPTVAPGPAFTAMVGADHRHRVGILDVDGQWSYGKWRKGGV